MKFIREDDKPVNGFSVGIALNRKPTKGDVGIEIEVEGKKLLHNEDVPLPWTYHVDHSLRGAESAEYVLGKPINFADVPGAVKTLFDKLAERKAVIDDSNRTSVHVHLNAQSFHFNRLTSFMAIYFVLEEVLTEWCGEHRVGNLFCLRAKDAPAIVSQLRKFIKSDGQFELRDHLHYAGLNANALHKYGSLEVRTLRGVSDPDTIANWVGVLERIYNLSAEFTDPRDICATFSAEGPIQFFYSMLGDKAQLIRNGVGMTDEQIGTSMMDGIRLAQDLCYCRDWGLFKAVELKPDPFGRDPRKMMKKVAAFNVGEALAAVGDAPAVVPNVGPGGFTWANVPPPAPDHDFIPNDFWEG